MDDGFILKTRSNSIRMKKIDKNIVDNGEKTDKENNKDKNVVADNKKEKANSDKMDNKEINVTTINTETENFENNKDESLSDKNFVTDEKINMPKDKNKKKRKFNKKC
ncbi:hypothetical protein MHBO_000807 [Bonamia ostreae]|uniref:Uncharacterized protein n=1 Tax=Bonamia ostreae TaxID=126728 RepID=A0ABV2AH02_9EUKA